MEQLNEVDLLLSVIEKLAGHPTQFGYIRAAVANRLSEIDAQLNPNLPVEEEPAEEPPEDEATPVPTTREPADAA